VAEWVVQLLNGTCFGFLLFLISVGLSIILGLMGILNLAHGSFYLFGAYIGLSVSRWNGSLPLAVLAGAVAGGVIGAVVERGLLRRLYQQHIEQVLLTFGLLYIFADLSKLIWGPDPQRIAKPLALAGSVGIMGISYPVYRLVVVVIGIAVAITLWLLQEKTRLGSTVRAGVDDKQMAAGLGVNIGLIFTLVFSLGAFLASFGGVIGAPYIGIYAGLDMDIMLLALIVVVIGGLGSLQGALVGSLLIGIMDSLGRALFPDQAMFTMYGIMILILVFRPSGLWGRR
jgi:branched-chain amino acid transport system permease protein